MTTPTRPLQIALTGNAYQIGLRHGELLKPQIHSQISIYTSMFASTTSLSWPEILAIARTYIPTIRKLTPSLWEETEGIALGADVGVEEIVALNCRSEIALGMFDGDGCTALGWKLQEGRKGEGGVILAQNWDWVAPVKENLVMMSIEQEGKPKIWMVTEAGMVGKIGFNSSSVGTNLNAIRAKPTDSSKLPIHLALRLCLESTTAASAIKTLEDLGGVATSCHILIADPSGPIGLELSPKGDVYLQPNERGIVCHTNHFLENHLVDEPPWLSGSPVRLARCEELTKELDESGKEITPSVLRSKVFADSSNSPQAICCLEDPARPKESRSSTLFNIIMRFGTDVTPSAEVVWGKPGTSEEGPVLRMPW